MEHEHPQRFVVDRFAPGETEAEAREAMQRLRSTCERLANVGEPIRYLGGTFVVADEAMTCRFEGSARAVRAVHAEAGLAIDRLLPAIEVDPR
jgi:hypothetical protein